MAYGSAPQQQQTRRLVFIEMASKSNYGTSQQLIYGTGADTSAFRQLPYLMRLGRAGLGAAKFALPGAVMVLWLAYPALDPEFKKRNNIP